MSIYKYVLVTTPSNDGQGKANSTRSRTPGAREKLNTTPKRTTGAEQNKRRRAGAEPKETTLQSNALQA